MFLFQILYVIQSFFVTIMKCLEILQFLRQKCNKCFKDKQPQKEREVLKQSLVEMKQLNQQKTLEKYKKTDLFQRQNKESLTKSVVMVQITSEPEQEIISKEFVQSDHVLEPELTKEKRSLSEDEFESIQSSLSFEKENVMGSTKRLANQLEKIKKRKPSSEVSLRNSESYYSSQVEETPSYDKLNIVAETDKLREWMKQEYGKSRYASFRISHAVKLRMHGQAMTNHIIHKFQDFRTNFLYESAEHSGYFFTNHSKTLEAEYHYDEPTSHLGKQKITTYIKIKCFTNKITPILQLVSSKGFIQLHGFPFIKTVDYEGGFLGLTLPILEVSQGGKKSREALVYHLASQLSEEYRQQQGRQVVLVSYSLDDGENSWQRVVKILMGVVGEVEVYCQAFQQSNSSLAEKFKNNFLAFEKWCQEMKLIPAH